MAQHLVVTTHAHETSAVVVLEGTVDAFGGAAFVVANIFSKLISRTLFGTGFGLGSRLAAPAWVLVDDGHAGQRRALFSDLGRIISAVHEIVEIGDASGRDGREWDRHLAVVDRR